MKIWLIKLAEAAPFKYRQLGRTGSLAEYLSKNGHQAVWWKSTFSHGEKKFYFKRHTQKKINKNETVVFLHSPIAYKKNISIQRILFYQKTAAEFAKYAKKKEKPDIILCSWPPAPLAREAIKYGKENNIPVVLDARDMWPDIFERFFYGKTSKLFLYPLKRQAHRLFAEAAGITAVQEHALKWACNYAGRVPGKYDRAIYIGIKMMYVPDDDMKKCLSWWKERDVTPDTWNICFWGSLRHSGLDLDTCIKAVKKLEKKYPDIRLVIGGEGDSREKLIKTAGNSKAVVFAGHLNGYQMSSAMSICKAGAYCLENTEDFIDTISNKAIQYLSAGLPILNSLKGLTHQLIFEYSAGLTYEEGDADECAAAIEHLYLHPQERDKMAVNAKRLYDDKFDADKMNKNFEDYLSYIIDQYQKGKIQ